jgi:hypothetical protein
MGSVWFLAWYCHLLRPQSIVYIEECCLVGYGATWVYYKPTFRRNIASIFGIEEIAWARKSVRWLLTDWHFSSPSLFLLPWRWGRHVPPKHQFLINPHGAISHKTAFFIVIAVQILQCSHYQVSDFRWNISHHTQIPVTYKDRPFCAGFVWSSYRHIVSSHSNLIST